MARISASGFLGGLLPRYPLEMTVASLGTFLVVTLWFDLPHRWQAPVIPPPAEKLSLQAEPLPIRMFRPSEDHEASAFMEAVALSHVAPLRPEGEVDRAGAEPPPAVQVLARTPSRDKPKPVASAQASVPQPAPRPAVKVAAVAPSPAPAAAPASPATAELRPPASIPPTRPVERSRFELPAVSEMARSARHGVADGLDSLSRGVSSIIHWR